MESIDRSLIMETKELYNVVLYLRGVRQLNNLYTGDLKSCQSFVRHTPGLVLKIEKL